jgi:hypothetical protein
MKKPESHIGESFKNVTLELFLDNVTRPRVRAVDIFSGTIRVEFPRDLREKYPIGTKFKATVKVCQKHSDATRQAKGVPYLRATEVLVIESSIPSRGMKAKVKSGSISGRSYEYDWKKS